MSKNKNYLITVEGGRNNIGGCDLHILKSSFIISAVDIESAMEKLWKEEDPTIFHFGHRSDYTIISNIKEIPL